MIRSKFRSISFRFYESVHHKLYQKYSLAAGDAYNITTTDDDTSPFDQFIQYYNAFETYPRRALYYLNKARNFETAIIPASEPSYNLEEGILLKNRSQTAKAIDGLDPVWERDLISQCYSEFARAGQIRGPLRFLSKEGEIAAVELFAMNRGALLQAGLSLPLEINLRHAERHAGEGSNAKEKTLYRALSKAGFIRINNREARFRLDITLNKPSEAYTAVCELIDIEGEKKPFRKIIPLRSLSRVDLYAFAGVLSNAVFREE
jgi:hypothetical protein